MDVFQAKHQHTHTVINLHGRDSNATEYAQEFFESATSEGGDPLDMFPSVRWVFPTAPLIHSRRFGVEMSQWFDMWSTEDPNEQSHEQLQDLRSSVSSIKQLVLDEAETIGLDNIILCGISQGAALAFSVLFDLNVRICGLIGFSTWLSDAQPGFANDFGAQQTPVFLAHCSDDEVIAIDHGRAAATSLEKIGMSVDWHEYSTGGHWINESDGMKDLVKFLKALIAT